LYPSVEKQFGNGIDHLPALALLIDQPVQEFVHHGKVLRPDVRVVFVKMFEVALFYHGSFIDVKGDGDTVVVRDGGELFYILNVSPADVGVEKNGVAVAV
jgi:hypothetical protein